MKFYFFCHAFGSDLPDVEFSEALSLAAFIGAEWLLEPYLDRVIVSRSAQARRLAEELVPAFTENVIFTGNECLDTFRQVEWAEHLRATQGRPDPSHPFVIEESLRMIQEFWALAIGFSANQDVLAVGHSGLLETLIHALTGEMPKKMDECECVVIEIDPRIYSAKIVDGFNPNHD